MTGLELRLELAAWRSAVCPDASTCLLLFGIGPETLERIESGEVEPEADVAERIARHITRQTALPGSAFDRSADPTCAGGNPTDSAGVFYDRGPGAGGAGQHHDKGN